MEGMGKIWSKSEFSPTVKTRGVTGNKSGIINNGAKQRGLIGANRNRPDAGKLLSALDNQEALVRISAEATMMRQLSIVSGQATGALKRIEEQVYASFSACFSFQISLSEREGNEKAIEGEDAELDKLDAMLGEWSSDAVSDRIVEFAKAVYSWYSGESAEAPFETDGAKPESQGNFEHFFNKVSRAIDSGFGGAKTELGNPGGVIGRLIARTYGKVQEKLQAWKQSMSPEQTT